MMVFGIAENRYLLVKVNREKNILNINEHAEKGYSQVEILERTNGIDDWIANGKTADVRSNGTTPHFRANPRGLETSELSPGK